MSAGERIRDARKRRGITQKELADLVGCSQQTIVDIEGQDRPRSRFLSTIVRELHESLEWIENGRLIRIRSETVGRAELVELAESMVAR